MNNNNSCWKYSVNQRRRTEKNYTSAHHNQSNDKEENLKACWSKKYTYGMMIKISVDFSLETMQTRWLRHNIFKELKGKWTCQARILYPEKNIHKNEVKIIF